MWPFYVFYWHFSFRASRLSAAEHRPLSKNSASGPFPSPPLLFLSFSPRLIFCSRTTAAALLQSLALIHTSDPPDTLSALPQCTSAPKLSQTHLAFSLSLLLLPPSSAPFLSLGLPTALHRPVSCAVCLFFPKLSKFPPFLSPYSATGWQKYLLIFPRVHLT